MVEQSYPGSVDAVRDAALDVINTYDAGDDFHAEMRKLRDALSAEPHPLLVAQPFPGTETPFGYLMEKAGINNGYYFITPAEFEHVEDRFKSHLKPVYEGPVAVAQAAPVLGDIVQVKEGTTYFHDWRGVEMKLVSLRIDPLGKYWASLADKNPRSRGLGFYDGETTDFEFDHLEKAPSITSTEGK